MPVFPSAEWFEEVRSIFNGDDTYRTAGGGTADALVGIMVEDSVFLLTFEGLECTGVREIAEDELEDADFYLDMPSEQWREMLENIKDNNGADLEHTLNTIDLSMLDGLAQTMNDDQYRHDLFFRYNQTFQYFFDASARIETEFQHSAASASD